MQAGKYRVRKLPGLTGANERDRDEKSSFKRRYTAKASVGSLAEQMDQFKPRVLKAALSAAGNSADAARSLSLPLRTVNETILRRSRRADGATKGIEGTDANESVQ